MDFDLDPFGDALPEPSIINAKPGGKFQPRVKQRQAAKPNPRKETSELVNSGLPDAANDKSIALLSTVTDTDDGLKDPVSSTIATFVDIGAKEPQKDNEISSSHENRSLEATNPCPESRENMGSVGPMNLEAATPDGNGDQNPSFVKSAGQAGCLGFDMDAIDNILPEPHTSTSLADAKFQPKAKLQLQKEISAPVSSSLSNCTKEQHATIVLADCQTSQYVESVGIANCTFDQVGLDPSLPDQGRVVKVSNGDVNSKNAQPAELKCGNNVNRDSRFGESALEVEVDCIGLELDYVSDSVPEPLISKVRAGGKFQPRTKAQPRKETSKAVAFDVPIAVEKAASLASSVSDKKQSAKSVNARDGSRNSPVYSSLTTFESFGAKEPAQNSSSGAAVGDLHSSLGMGEYADMFLGLEYIHDYVTQSTSGTESPALDSNENNLDGKFSYLAQNSVNFSGSRACDVATLVSASCEESAVQMDNDMSGLEVSSAFHDTETMENPYHLSEATIASESCTRKFQSMSKAPTGILSPDAVESVIPPVAAESVPSETVNMNEGSIPALLSDDTLDYLPTSVGSFIPSDASISEFQMDEERARIAQTSRSDNANVEHSEDVPALLEKECSKSRKRKSSSALNLSQSSKISSLSGELNEKPTRQLRKQAAVFNEAHDKGGLLAEPPNSSAVHDEDNGSEYRVDEDSDDDYRAENTYGKERASKKSKKPVAEKEKPVRKCKRANDAPEQLTHEPPRKFSHSTRRNKRCVNKDLLNMPEEEIDFKRLPLRDIILFAEYKERLVVKEARASEPPLTNQSTEESIHREDSHNEEDTFGSERHRDYDGDDNDVQTNSRAQLNPPLFNCQSFMDKTPATRWSKQDTELFYEGIRQFGTDLSMIQQLFPGRTRHQVKLKLKKEERQHPLRLTEALNNRAKDHSYFEKVIEQLQKVQNAAAEAEKESNRDDSLSMIGEEAELNAETNEEVEQSERNEDIAVKDQEADVIEDHNSLNCGESDDYLDIWSSYKSEF